MKKYFLFICIVFLIAFNINAYAVSLTYLSDQSAEFYRMLNRNGSTDSADTVFYNPAGAVKMKRGLYFNLTGAHIADVTAEIEDQDMTHFVINHDAFKFDTNDLDRKQAWKPSFFALYNQKKWALFTAFYAPAGKGNIELDGGEAVTRIAIPLVVAANNVLISEGRTIADINFLDLLDPAFQTNLLADFAANGPFIANNIDKLKIFTYFYAGTLGGSFAINKTISISASVRYIKTSKRYQITAKIPDAIYTIDKDIGKVDLDARGFGGIFSINIAPLKELNIGFRYETATKLKYDTTLIASAGGHTVFSLFGFRNGGTDRYDLPAVAAIGIEYTIIPKLKIAPSLNYYFIKQAIWKHDDIIEITSSRLGITDMAGNQYKRYDNGWEAGIAFEYRISKGLAASIGYLYAKTGANNKTRFILEPTLDAHVYGLGFKYIARENLEINIGASWQKYIEGDINNNLGIFITDVTLKKDLKIIALGAQYKAL